MAKSYIKIETTSHMRFYAYTHPAYTKGDSVIPLDGNPGNWIVDASDDNETANGPVTYDIGRIGKVASIAKADLVGSPGVAAKIYNLAAGGWTMADGGETPNVLAGVITRVGAASVSFLEA
ncbi:hypothetical protein FACS1894151_08100 [Spirochaetia bacterium]|nr:hypothetical protein FACS1894151_08100 [Spirochaetia bacterium]